MTDRINAIVVVLENDIRDDQIESLYHAIEQMRGVLSVTGNVTDINTMVVKQRLWQEMINKLFSIINNDA